MKKYIFLTFAVRGIGGTQIYVRNKMNYLIRHGWDVTVITTEVNHKDQIVVKELEPFDSFVFPELLQNPNLYTEQERRDILDRLTETIGLVEADSVIEPNFIQVTFWGELLAEKLHIRNFVFLIQEDYNIGIPSYLQFYQYKLERGEFAVNTHHALKKMFDGFINLPEGKDAFLSATCHNVVENIDTDLPLKLPEADVVIGMIGRINKPFVLPVIGELAKYCEVYKDKMFLVLMLGGSPNTSDYESIKLALSQLDNCKVYISGPIFPIPYELLRIADVFVSSAGAAATSADAGFITISIDANDYQPIGILNITTKELIHRPEGQSIPALADLLDDVLVYEKYKHEPHELIIDQQLEEDFGKHLDMLDNAVASLHYYDIKKIKPTMGLRVQFALKRIKARFDR